MYEIITDFLPKRGKLLDWKNSIGCEIPFKDIDKTVIIYKYEVGTQIISLKKSDGETRDIRTSHLLKSNYNNVFNIRTGDFKYSINEDIDNLNIIDRKTVKNENNKIIKYYKYKCKVCGFDCGEHYKNGKLISEYWITEAGLIRGNRCACCNKSSKIVVENINSIIHTDKWMIPYFVGGYDKAKRYTKSSNKSICTVCPDCGIKQNKKIKISDIYANHSIGCICGDGISYPEKILYSVLSQLKEEYIYQLTKTNFEWCNKYKYDFFIPNSNILIEANGMQHYEESFKNIKSNKKIRNYKEEVENDRIKKELALVNGIKEENYIVIDCRYSDLEFIKNSILNNEKMKNNFNLSEIDWSKAEEFALSNLVKEVCLYFSNNNVTTGDISKKFKIHRSTASTWLKKGNEVNWCKYDMQLEMTKSGKKHGKQVEIFKNNISLGIFPSTRELDRQSLKLFGTKLSNSKISEVCNLNLKQHKDYTFKYV